MKIALITHSSYPNFCGGREKHVYTLAKNLGKKYDVTVFTCSGSLFTSYIERHKNFKICFLRTINIPIEGRTYRIPIGLLKFLFKYDPYIVHAHDLHQFTSVISCLYAKLKRKKFILTEHGYPRQIGIIKIIMKVYEKLFLRFLTKDTRIIAVSSFIKDELKSRYGIKNGITVVNNFIDIEEFKIKSKKFVNIFDVKNKRIILAIGRLSEEKGFQTLIKAFKLVNQKVKGLQLIIIGNGKLRNFLKNLAENENIDNNVKFTGELKNDTLKSAIYCSDIFVIPSLYESFGIVALEAMAYKKPIIAASTGGLKEFLKDRETCLFFEPNNIKELSESILKLLNDEKLAKNLSQMCEKAVKRFKPKAAIEKIIEIYNN